MICAGSGFSVSLVIGIHIFNYSHPSKYEEVSYCSIIHTGFCCVAEASLTLSVSLLLPLQC